MHEEKKREDNSAAWGLHQYNDSLTTLRRANKDLLQQPIKTLAEKRNKQTRKQDWLVILFCFVLFYGVSTLFESFNAELGDFHKSFKQFNLAYV